MSELAGKPVNHMFLWCEAIVLFFLLPLILAINTSVYLSIALVLSALVYFVHVSMQIWGAPCVKSLFRMACQSLFSKPKPIEQMPKAGKMKLRFSLSFMGFIILTISYMLLNDSDRLFIVVLETPLLWITIVFVYVFLSVLPQEYLYRALFFKRYERLMSSKPLFILFNACAFCVAHLMFHNTLVLILTFCGGLLFGYTYSKTRSYFWVCIEHSFYGLWLFTVGMGAMLAFPGP